MAREDGDSGRAFRPGSFDAQRKRRQRQLFVFEFHDGADGLARKEMLGQDETHGDAGESDRGEDAGDQDDGDEARENQKQKIVAGVQRRKGDEEDSGQVDPACARNAVVHLVAEPAERRALGQDGNESDAHPGGNGESGERRSAGESELAEFRGRAGIERQEQGGGERGHGEKESAHGGAIGSGPELREGGIGSAHFGVRRRKTQVPPDRTRESRSPPGARRSAKPSGAQETRFARNDNRSSVKINFTEWLEATEGPERTRRFREERIPSSLIFSAAKRGAS